MKRRLGSPQRVILDAQGNLAGTYSVIGRKEQSLHLLRDVYLGNSKLCGDENLYTLVAANNYANQPLSLNGLKEAKSLLRKTIPVARRVVGENDELTIKMGWTYAEALHKDEGATLDDVREAVTTLEDAGRTARRVLGGAHPLTEGIEETLRESRAALDAQE